MKNEERRRKGKVGRKARRVTNGKKREKAKSLLPFKNEKKMNENEEEKIN